MLLQGVSKDLETPLALALRETHSFEGTINDLSKRKAVKRVGPKTKPWEVDAQSCPPEAHDFWGASA